MVVRDLELHKRRIGDAQDVTPEELLRIVLEDVQGGHNPGDVGYNAYPITRIVIIAISDEGEGREGLNVYRCNMNRPEQMGYLATAMHQGIHFWCNNADGE